MFGFFLQKCSDRYNSKLRDQLHPCRGMIAGFLPATMRLVDAATIEAISDDRA